MPVLRLMPWSKEGRHQGAATATAQAVPANLTHTYSSATLGLHMPGPTTAALTACVWVCSVHGFLSPVCPVANVIPKFLQRAQLLPASVIIPAARPALAVVVHPHLRRAGAGINGGVVASSEVHSSRDGGRC